MQDSEDDWAAVANSMADVYKNAVINISATNPGSLRNGFLVNRSFDARPFTAEVFSAESCPRRSLIELMYGDYWGGIVSSVPINQRGWVMQERLLSPRTLYFTPKETAWECGGLLACESHPRGFATHMGGPALKKSEYMLRSRAEGGLENPHLERVWQDVVATYTACELTKEHDKLVALSGIASEVQSHLKGDRYLAGLWKSNLLVELLWTINPFSFGRRPYNYRAPTWSWASIDGRIQFLWVGTESVPVVELVDATTSLDNPLYRMGSVEAGTLRFRAPLLRLVDSMTKGIAPIENRDDVVSCEVSIDIDDSEAEFPDDGLLLLPIFANVKDRESSTEEDYPEGLRVEGDDNLVYTQGIVLRSPIYENEVPVADRRLSRVGCFFSSDNDDEIQALLKRTHRWDVTIE